MDYVMIIVFLILSYSLSAQEHMAKIHFLDGSSQYGFAEIRGSKVLFAEEYEGKNNRYDDDDLSHVEIMEGNRKGAYYYKTILGRKKVVLAQLYFEGKINLYRIYSKGGYVNHGMGIGSETVDTEDFFINRDIEDKQVLNLGKGDVMSKEFKRTIAPEYFGDCLMLMKKIRTDFFGKNKIKNVVTMYNTQCN